MNKIFIIFLLAIFVVSCSTVEFNKNDKMYILFEDVLMKEKDLTDFFTEFEKAAGDKVNKAALEAIKTTLEPRTYNEKLISYAKSHKDFKKFDEIQSNYLLGSMAKKVQLLRINTFDINKFEEYIDRFKNLEDSSKRIELIEAILKNDFPRHVAGHLISHISTLLIKDIANENIENVYKKIFSNIDMITFKINLYAFQKMTTPDLEEIVKSQKSEEYKFSRKYLEECQSNINTEMFKSIKRELISRGINTGTILKLEELKLNSRIDL